MAVLGGIKKINESDAIYPESLKNITRPPSELYVDGNIIPEDKDAIAIVGTRRPTTYGIRQAEHIAYELALRGITIISGMARGIDTKAHEGALRAKGRTIAILGSGLNKIYPPENKRLSEKIAKNGALISEFPLDTPPYRSNFPRRNRIISGMSKGVLVVEAAQKSGSLITANFALEEGREVFAIPGCVTSPQSAGTNALIKEGAKLVERTDDILEELGMFGNKEDMKNKGSLISDEEKKVFDILTTKPKEINEISENAKLPSYKVVEILFKLQLKRLAKALPGNNFMRF